jgi:hypothetical protein
MDRLIFSCSKQAHGIPVMIGEVHNYHVGELKRAVLKLMLALLEGSVFNVLVGRASSLTSA